MGIVELNIERKWGTPYVFEKWRFQAPSSSKKTGTLHAKFTRLEGLRDDITSEEAPLTHFQSVVSLKDWIEGNVSHSIAQEFKVRGKKVRLFPKEELMKAAISIPHELSAHDDMATRYFHNRHEWPYKPWDYKGLTLVKK